MPPTLASGSHGLRRARRAGARRGVPVGGDPPDHPTGSRRC